MPNYCVVCKRETESVCGCCRTTHYCSKACQKHDFHFIHRYERTHLMTAPPPPEQTSLGANQGGGASARRRRALEPTRPRDKGIVKPQAGRAFVMRTTEESEETVARIIEE